MPIYYAGTGGNSDGELGLGYKSGGAVRGPVEAVELAKFGPEGIGLGYFSQIFRAKGFVYGLGANDMGQGGNGTHRETTHPVRVHGLEDVVEIAMGGAHCLARKADGSVWRWGGTFDMAGALPRQVPLPEPAVKIYAGAGVSIVRLASGAWMGFGENKSGQFCDGTTKDKPDPITLPYPTSGVKKLAVGGVPSEGVVLLLLMDDGTVKAAGANGAGQLGLGMVSKQPVTTLTDVPLSGVADVSCSVSHALFTMNFGGNVLASGSGVYGELGNGTTKSLATPTLVTLPVKTVKAVAGWRTSVFVGEDGLARSCGWHQHGNSGQPGADDVLTPTVIRGLTNVRDVIAGEYTTMFVTADPPPPVALTLEQRPGQLIPHWVCDRTSTPFKVQLRKRGKPGEDVPWGPPVNGKQGVPASAREYDGFRGLTPGQEYEVHVQNKMLGGLTAIGTPV